MSDRVDDYLQGQLDRDGLTAAERSEADAIGRAIDDTRAFLGGRSAPDVTGSVMRQIAGVRPSSSGSGRGLPARVAWIVWNPVRISIRPAYVLAGAAAAALLFVALPIDGPDPAGAGTAPPLFVQFRLEADASSVQLAGSFTNWERRYELHQTEPGLWTITVPLSQGVHDYAFLVDGEYWVPDPYASQVSDGFGGTNSRLTLLLPSDTQS